MFETVTKTESRWRFLWPDVSHVSGAEDGIKLGYWGAYLVAGLTTIIAVLGILGASLGSLADAVVFAVIGLGIQRKWRTAAIIGLILFTINLIVTLTRGSGMSILAIFIFLGFVAAVRGTFAYHRLVRQAEATSRSTASEGGSGAAEQGDEADER